jgi:hypothetical protein
MKRIFLKAVVRFSVIMATVVIALSSCNKSDVGHGPTPPPVPYDSFPKPAPTVLSIFNGVDLTGWDQVPANSWEVVGGVMRSKGTARGTISTTKSYTHYRAMFTVRQVSGNHNPCILFSCFPVSSGLDALGGLQFQMPHYTWDYRVGHNNNGSAYFKGVNSDTFSKNSWMRVEVLVDKDKGIARIAEAQPVGNVGIDICKFTDLPSTVVTGPFALQMHNSGIIDEYKDLTIEENPEIDDLILTRNIIEPTALLATATATQVNLTWKDNSNNETGFKIEQSTDNVSWTVVTTTGANIIKYAVTGLTAKTKYYFRVSAVNATDISKYAIANATIL